MDVSAHEAKPLRIRQGKGEVVTVIGAERYELDTVVAHQQLVCLINDLLAPFPGPAGECLRQYFILRAESHENRWQDLIPYLSYRGLSDGGLKPVLPVTAAWALALASAHAFDSVQDRGALRHLNAGTLALGCANLALAHLDTEVNTLRVLLEAIGQVTMLGANAQAGELRPRYLRSRKSYLTTIAGKAAAIIATGVWLGGILATDNDEELQLLRAFGLALGMSLQLGDDCKDLAEDLKVGLYTLPVIEATTLVAHPDLPTLLLLLQKETLSPDQITNIITLLNRMGAVKKVLRLARAFQIQAAAALDVLPVLKPYFGRHVGL